MATRKGRYLPDTCVNNSYEIGRDSAPYLSILVNNIELTGEAVRNMPPNFIVYTLATAGGAAYNRQTNLWAEFKNIGLLRSNGLPRRIIVKGDNQQWSRGIDVAAGEWCIFPANAEYIPPVAEISYHLAIMKEIRVNLLQNLNVLRQATAIVTDDPDLDNQIQKAEKERSSGKTTVTIHKKVGSDLNIETFSPNAQSHLMEYMELYNDYARKLDAIIGVSHITEKDERRTVEEITLIESEADTIITLLISSINRFAEWYGVDIHAEKRNRLKQQITPTKDDNAQEEEETANNDEQ